MRSNNEISVLPHTSPILPPSDEFTFLISILKSHRSFKISPRLSLHDKGIPFEKPWLIVKSLSPSGYLISEGDVIRLGKVKLKVKEIRGFKQSNFGSKSIHSKNFQSGGLGHSNRNREKCLEIDPKLPNGQISCRICLGDETDNLNPLLSLCYCTGSMGILHISCLQEWLGSKLTKSIVNHINTYEWKTLECEICKFKYPSQVKVSDTIVDLIDIQKPEGDFIIFQSFTEETNRLSIIPMSGKKTIKLGRANDSDFKVSDISVSRNHANIQVKNSGLYLTDLNSKFGTLVKITKKVCVDIGSKVELQSGKTLLKISTSRNWSFFSCFTSCSKSKTFEGEVRDNTQETYVSR